MDQHVSMFRDVAPMYPVDLYAQDLYAQTPSYQLFLQDSKPADFLAIRKTQGKQRCNCREFTQLTQA